MRGANGPALSLRFDPRQVHARARSRTCDTGDTWRSGRSASRRRPSRSSAWSIRRSITAFFCWRGRPTNDRPPRLRHSPRWRRPAAAAPRRPFLLIAANMTSWIVAVSGSYILNSSITFAAESGRKLRWRHYLAFLVAGIVGLIANTATLVFAAQILLLAGLCGESLGDPGELCRQFLAVALRGVSGARQRRRAGEPRMLRMAVRAGLHA